MYLDKKESALNTSGRRKLETLQSRIDRIYHTPKVFSLSLKTLELTRSFHHLYKNLEFSEAFNNPDHALLAMTRRLERALDEEFFNSDSHEPSPEDDEFASFF